MAIKVAAESMPMLIGDNDTPLLNIALINIHFANLPYQVVSAQTLRREKKMEADHRGV